MGENKEERKILFSPDEPIKDSEKDAFDHKYFVNVLMYVITNCTTPINIALYGKWGVGKSTILNFLEERIKQDKEKLKLVIIDVWKLSPKLLRQEFLEELNRKLKSIPEEKIESELWHFKEEDISAIPKIDLKSREAWTWILFYFAIFAVLAGVGFVINPIVKNHDILTPSIILSVAIPVFLAMISSLKQISRNAAKSGKKIIPRIESSYKFHLLFQEIIEKRKNQKLIIAIDNLDRCDDESVVNILNMIKTFLNEPNCIFVVSCDQDAIVKHLVQTKGQFYEERDAIEFLTKFFQITLHIAPQITEQLYSYAKNQLEIFSSEIKVDPDVVDVLVAGITKNPRKIKQFVYNFAIVFKLAEIKENSGILANKIITTNAPFLAKIVVLREEWPDFFRRLETTPYMLELLQDYIDDERSVQRYESLMIETLDKNQGLEHFLKSTSLISAVQILPFIQLNQESFESLLPEFETLILKVNQNDYDYVIKILYETEKDQQHNYILEIIKLCEQYIKDRRIQVAFNSVDILLKVYDIVPEESQQQIVKFLSTYMPRREILDYVSRFDMNLLFPVILLMGNRPKEILLTRYANTINTHRNMSVSIVQKFIEFINEIPLSISKKVDESLQLLEQNNEETILDCLDILETNENATRKFVQEKSIDALIHRIRPNQKDRAMNLYLKLKYVANEENQSNFVDRILSSIGEDKTNTMNPNSVVIFKNLKEFSASDFSEKASKKLYLLIKHLIPQYADINQKNIVLEIILKIYPNLPKESQNTFVTETFVPYITQQPPHLSTILEMVSRENIQILEYDTVIDNVFSMLQTNPFNESSINYVIICTPKEKWSKICEKIIHLIKSMDIGNLQTFSSSYSKHFSKIPQEFRTKIVEQILSASRQFSPDQSQPVYSILLASLEGISENIVGQFTDVFNNLIQSSEPRYIQFGIDNMQNCFIHTSLDKKRQIFKVIFERFRDSFSTNQNLGVVSFNFLVNFNNEMNSEEKEIFSSLMLEILTNGNPKQIVIQILNSLKKIQLENKRESIYDVIERLQNSPDNDIKNKIKEIMEK